MKYFCIFLLPFIVLACNVTIDLENERENLIQTDREFALLPVESGAAEAFNQYLTDNALQLPARRNPIQGRINIYDNMKENQDKYTLNWSPQYAEVSSSGELGYTWGTYTLTIVDEYGEEQKSYGKYLNIWKKQKDGSWKVAVDMGNESPKPN
jgi:ketosteroid isomerase-like protein